jgi:hypothetical protein
MNIMKKKYHIVGTLQIFNRKNVERGKIDTLPDKYMTSWLSTGSTVKSGGIKIVLLAPISLLIAMKRSCYSFRRVTNLPTQAYNSANSALTKNAIILNIMYNILIFVTQKFSYVQY